MKNQYKLFDTIEEDQVKTTCPFWTHLTTL